MIKNILVLLTGSDTDKSVLQTALLAARPFAARLDCLFVRPGPLQVVLAAALGQFDSAMNNVALIRSIETEAAERSASAHASFDDFRSAHQDVKDAAESRHGVCAAYRELEGEALEHAITEARFNDLVVLAPGPRNGGFSRGDIGTLLLSAGRPVLLSTLTPPECLGSISIIAWKETAEAARAISVAMPLLAKADRIFVLTADEGEREIPAGIDSAGRMAGQLRAHGMPAEANCVVLGGRRASDAILKTARELDGDLLVMGAYGHSRARELIFGGFTKQVLDGCRLPVLLFH